MIKIPTYIIEHKYETLILKTIKFQNQARRGAKIVNNLIIVNKKGWMLIPESTCAKLWIKVLL